MNIKQLINLLLKLIPFLNIKNEDEIIDNLNLIKTTMNKEETPQESVLRVAKEMIGKDASPRDQAPDELGCAESLANVLHAIDPNFSPAIVSTTKLYKALMHSPKYEATFDLEAGNILISPTGYGKYPRIIPNGHCGVFVEPNWIASNDSIKGTWEQNYTLSQWIKRYRNRGGYPLFVFRKVA